MLQSIHDSIFIFIEPVYNLPLSHSLCPTIFTLKSIFRIRAAWARCTIHMLIFLCFHFSGSSAIRWEFILKMSGIEAKRRRRDVIYALIFKVQKSIFIRRHPRRRSSLFVFYTKACRFSGRRAHMGAFYFLTSSVWRFG